MKRKIIRQGNNTLTITLPRQWTTDFKVKAGDELDVELKGNRIILSTGKSLTNERISKDIANLTSILPIYILMMYRKGYDEIELSFDNPKLLMVISNVVRDIGFHLLDQGKNQCTLKALSDVDNIESGEMIRKLFLSIKIKLDKIIESLENKDPYLLQSIIVMNKIPARITNFCYRLVSKKRIPGLETYYIPILRDLENLDNILNLFIESITDIKNIPNIVKIIKTIEEFKKLFELYYISHFSDDLKNFPRLMADTKTFLENIYLQATDQTIEENKMFLLLNNSSLHLDNLINTTFLMKI